MKAKFKLKDRVIIDKNAYPTLHQGKWIITNVQNVLNQYRYTVTEGLFQVIVLENEIKLVKRNIETKAEKLIRLYFGRVTTDSGITENKSCLNSFLNTIV